MENRTNTVWLSRKAQYLGTIPAYSARQRSAAFRQTAFMRRFTFRFKTCSISFYETQEGFKQVKTKTGEENKLSAPLLKAEDLRGYSLCESVSRCQSPAASAADVQTLQAGYIIHRALPLYTTGLKGGDGTR